MITNKTKKMMLWMEPVVFTGFDNLEIEIWDVGEKNDQNTLNLWNPQQTKF